MYRVTKQQDGSFFCEVDVQDGTERQIKQTLKEAVNWIKRVGEAMHRARIKKSDIEFFVWVEVTRIERVRVKAKEM